MSRAWPRLLAPTLCTAHLGTRALDGAAGRHGYLEHPLLAAAIKSQNLIAPTYSVASAAPPVLCFSLVDSRNPARVERRTRNELVAELRGRHRLRHVRRWWLLAVQELQEGRLARLFRERLGKEAGRQGLAHARLVALNHDNSVCVRDPHVAQMLVLLKPPAKCARVSNEHCLRSSWTLHRRRTRTSCGCAGPRRESPRTFSRGACARPRTAASPPSRRRAPPAPP